jgi:hypothetical protein
MDRTFRILAAGTIGCILVVGGIFGFLFFQERAATESLRGTLSFTITINTDHPLDNVTLLLPVPVDNSGSSPLLEKIGSKEISGLLPGWDTTLIGAREHAFFGISADQIPAVRENTTPYRLSVTVISPRSALDTISPESYSPVFRPRTAGLGQICPADTAGTGLRCMGYTGVVFAEYTAAPDAQVEIRLELVGRNTWQVMGEHTGEYRDTVALSLHGPARGWHKCRGLIMTGIGEDVPY